MRDRSLPTRYSRQKQAWIVRYKADRGCADCGEMDPVVLELDHVDPSNKDPMLRKGTKYGRARTFTQLGYRRMQAEVEKCEVVCANCHRRREARRRREHGVLDGHESQMRLEF